MTRRSLLRATIDTNLFISATIRRGAPYRLFEAWSRGEFTPVLSASIVSEVRSVQRRSPIRVKYGLTDAELLAVDRRIERSAEIVTDLAELPTDIPLRDPKDAPVLQTALTGRADYLLSRDGDLLTLNGHPSLGRLQIVTVDQFLALLEKDRS